MSPHSLSTVSHLYKSKEELEQFIRTNCQETDTNCQWLVCIHTCIHKPEEAVTVAKEVTQFLPEAKILGTSADAVIEHGTVCECCCLILFTKFFHTDITIHHLTYTERTPKLLARTTKKYVIRENTKAMLAFFSDEYLDAQGYLNCLSDNEITLPIAGGIISPNPYGAFAFDQNGIYAESLSLAALHSDSLSIYHKVVHGHEPFSQPYTITKTEGTYLTEIEHMPALEWFCKTLGVTEDGDPEKLSLTSDLLLRFPLLCTDDTHASRFVHYDEFTKRLDTYSTKIPSGTQFRLGYLSPLATASELRKICDSFAVSPCQTILTYSCTFRMTYLRSCTEWEMRLFRSCRISGAFLYGEIGMDQNRNALHIGSNVLFGLSESDTDYLPIDRSILGELQSLDEDWEDIYPYIIKIKNEQLSQQHLDFSSQIFQREENLRSDVFVDKETRLGNLVKYKYDNTKAQYDKICMISIEQGVLISGRRGTKVWNRVMQKNIQQIRTTLNDDRLSFYCNDKWSFFFTAEKSYPDDLFLQKSEQAFRDCGYCFCKEHGITAVNNFHVVIGETDLLEKVQLCMSSNADHNARFYVYNKENQEIIRQMDEKLFMTNVISDAILYDRIVPYFQPIRDNRTKKITKYEALMRLSDKDKNIYAPGQFLEIAKDYHLYLQLSQLMIRKVLHLFKNRTESIFINLSAYDIGSKSNRTFLYELLSSLSPDACQRITFEILESEKIRDFQEMVAFLNDIRRFGVKIAIDDFGAGFSNFTAIIRVNPDFIKIDGDLIINCDKDPVKQVCLQAITDIAKGIDAELIAEHVENSDEQKTVESVNIEYTQGYYFSKPVPYDRLDAAIS